jgi:hypothetical protein
MSSTIRLALIALFAVVLPAASSLAQAPGYVRVKFVKAGVMVGAGGGVLTYRGSDYPFRVSGLSLGVTAGASVSRLEGWASGIRQVSEFAGTYSSVGGGGAFVGGAGGVQLANENGVRLALRGPKLPAMTIGSHFQPAYLSPVWRRWLYRFRLLQLL